MTHDGVWKTAVWSLCNLVVWLWCETDNLQHVCKQPVHSFLLPFTPIIHTCTYITLYHQSRRNAWDPEMTSYSTQF